MLKPPLTEEKLNRVKFSLKKMSVLSQVLLMENQTEIVDTYFRIPNMNNFAKRILSDSKQLKSFIHTCGRVGVKFEDSDFAEDYAVAIWRVVTILCTLDIDTINEFVENLEKELEGIII